MAVVYSQTWDVDLGTPDGSNLATRDTVTKRTGAGALRLNCTADVAYWLKNAVGGAQQVIVMQAYLRFASLPTGSVPELFGTYATGPGALSFGYDQPSGKCYMEISNASNQTPNGPVLAINTWYRFDLKYVGNGGTISVDGMIDGTAITQNTYGSGPYSGGDYRIGEYGVAATYDLYVDDFQVSHVVTDYPIGFTVGGAGSGANMLTLGVG